MSAPSYFIRSLLRIYNLQGREVIEALVTGQFTLVADKGGKMATSLSANGKSFSFQVDSKLTTSGLMAMAEEALTYIDGSTEAQLTALLSTRPIKTTVAIF